MGIIDKIRTNLAENPYWGVYDGALSRRELIAVIEEFDSMQTLVELLTLERDNAIDLKDRRGDQVEALWKEITAWETAAKEALALLRTDCRACKYDHALDGPCDDCWLETYPGQPERTHRSHWAWGGTELPNKKGE